MSITNQLIKVQGTGDDSSVLSIRMLQTIWKTMTVCCRQGLSPRAGAKQGNLSVVTH